MAHKNGIGNFVGVIVGVAVDEVGPRVLANNVGDTLGTLVVGRALEGRKVNGAAVSGVHGPALQEVKFHWHT